MFSSTRVILTSLFILLALSSALAQGGTGQLSGSVADTNGAVVPGANVKLTSLVTAQEREAVTNDAGDFVFTLLPAGAYKLEITASGFRTVVVDEVRINVTQTTTLPIRLDAATVSGMVTINAEPPLVQRETSQVGRTIEENTIRQLPLPTRNFQQLLTLSPGTSSSVANNTELGRGDAIISVNGQRTTSNNVRINGIDANSIGTNSTPNIAVPATDTIQEFIVQTSLYDASQGRNAGGNVEAITKSGGNAFHGNAYYFLRNKALNTNDFFLNSARRPRPTLNRNQFGGTLGGPIINSGVVEYIADNQAASLANVILLQVGDSIELTELDLWHGCLALRPLPHDLLDLGFDASLHRGEACRHVIDLPTQLALGVDDPLPMRCVGFVSFAVLLGGAGHHWMNAASFDVGTGGYLHVVHGCASHN